MAGVGGVPLGDFSPAEYAKIKAAWLARLRGEYRADARGEGREPSLDELKAIAPDLSREALDRQAYAAKKAEVLRALRK